MLMPQSIAVYENGKHKQLIENCMCHKVGFCFSGHILQILYLVCALDKIS